MHRVFDLSERHMWGWSEEHGWQTVSDATDEDITSYAEYLRSGEAHGMPVTSCYPWLQDDLCTIEYHEFNGEGVDEDADSSSSSGSSQADGGPKCTPAPVLATPSPVPRLLGPSLALCGPARGRRR